MSEGKPNEKMIFWASIGLTALVCLVFIPLAPMIWMSVLRPTLGAIFSLLDVRGWSQRTWFVTNFVVLVLLLAVRYGPELLRTWRARGVQEFPRRHSSSE
jgi:hypothetical protein